jgi:hypothetical protein
MSSSFCHLSPTGGRLDKNGKEWVPPSGYGALAAFEGIDKTVAASEDKMEKVSADETPAPSDESPRPANGAVAAAVPSTVGTTQVENGQAVNSNELDKRMKDLSVDDNVPSPTSPANIDVSVVETAPGPPAGGPVVFDHPPTDEEKKLAEEILARLGHA